MGFSYGDITMLMDSFGEVGGSGGQTTVNRKGMGANIRAYGGRILLGFQSIKIKKFPEYFFGSKVALF